MIYLLPLLFAVIFEPRLDLFVGKIGEYTSTSSDMVAVLPEYGANLDQSRPVSHPVRHPHQETDPKWYRVDEHFHSIYPTPWILLLQTLSNAEICSIELDKVLLSLIEHGADLNLSTGVRGTNRHIDGIGTAADLVQELCTPTNQALFARTVAQARKPRLLRWFPYPFWTSS